jgi:hypothetical protein
MHLLQALLNFRLSPDQPPADAACAISIIHKGPAQHAGPTQCGDSASNAGVGVNAFSWHPFSKKEGSGSAHKAANRGPVELLPSSAASLIWAELSHDDRRNVLLSQTPLRSVFRHAVGRLQVRGLISLC